MLTLYRRHNPGARLRPGGFENDCVENLNFIQAVKLLGKELLPLANCRLDHRIVIALERNVGPVGLINKQVLVSVEAQPESSGSLRAV
jgi:hypothetical protein